MNTADRSLAGLDIALRRRFSFREMPPRPDLLDDIRVEGINIGELLRTINSNVSRYCSIVIIAWVTPFLSRYGKTGLWVSWSEFFG